jgi:hypothetical protein
MIKFFRMLYCPLTPSLSPKGARGYKWIAWKLETNLLFPLAPEAKKNVDPLYPLGRGLG